MASDDEGIAATRGETERMSAIERILKHPGRIVFGASIAIILVWGLYFWNFAAPLSDSREVWGQFGDFVGGTLNSIFGFASFALLLYSLHMQADELRLTRQELAATRVELAASSDAQKKQADHFEREAKKADHSQAINYIRSNYREQYSGVGLWVYPNSSEGHRFAIQRDSAVIIDLVEKYGRNMFVLDENLLYFVNKTIALDEHMAGLRSVYPSSPLLLDVEVDIAGIVNNLIRIELIQRDQLKFNWVVPAELKEPTPPVPPT